MRIPPFHCTSAQSPTGRSDLYKKSALLQAIIRQVHITLYKTPVDRHRYYLVSFTKHTRRPYWYAMCFEIIRVYHPCIHVVRSNVQCKHWLDCYRSGTFVVKKEAFPNGSCLICNGPTGDSTASVPYASGQHRALTCGCRGCECPAAAQCQRVTATEEGGLHGLDCDWWVKQG